MALPRSRYESSPSFLISGQVVATIVNFGEALHANGCCLDVPPTARSKWSLHVIAVVVPESL